MLCEKNEGRDKYVHTSIYLKEGVFSLGTENQSKEKEAINLP